MTKFELRAASEAANAAYLEVSRRLNAARRARDAAAADVARLEAEVDAAEAAMIAAGRAAARAG